MVYGGGVVLVVVRVEGREGECWWRWLRVEGGGERHQRGVGVGVPKTAICRRSVPSPPEPVPGDRGPVAETDRSLLVTLVHGRSKDLP